ncbi:MAG: class II glutamine amidotransferase, partial [Janthinobacterium lividum]
MDAPDSLAAQSRRNPDGAGVGAMGEDGTPVLSKQPLAAWDDPDFAQAAHDLRGTTFVAHVRYATTGARSVANTHPFVQDGRLFAHNGVVQGLDQLDARIAELGGSDLVQGDTDSERLFALITCEARRRDGDVQAAIIAAVTWIGANVPFHSVNLVLVTATELFALRYPDSNELYVLQRNAGTGSLDARSTRIRATSPTLADRASVVVASEPMDDDPGWRPLSPGELIHVDRQLQVVSSRPFSDRPTHVV